MTRGLFRCFVAGTDTGVGKTECAAALLSLLADRGMKPAALKPYESGVSPGSRTSDAAVLHRAARMTEPVERSAVHRFEEPLAPGVAASLLRSEPSWAQAMKAFRAFDGRSLVVEGAGGLRVPLDRSRDVIDLAVACALPVLLVGRAGLGTLNHVGLSLEALEARKLAVLAVLLVDTHRRQDPSVLHNPDWIRRRHRVPVLGPVPFVAGDLARRAAFRQALAPVLDAR